jgi:transcriptional regulator with GAF, ATPase, and Fis domain
MNTKSQTLLPALAPDLILKKQAGRWQIVEMSARLAKAGTEKGAQLKGRFVEQVFPASSPPLSPLLDDLLEQGQDVHDIKIRLRPAASSLLADFRLAGLSSDYIAPMAQIFLRPESIASRLETGYAGLIGQSPAMREVFRKIELYAATEAAVVITGETGCGKELVAGALHQRSQRSQGPFAAINCSAISEQLLESELFGHEKGAFTGAIRSHRGHFEQAQHGSLFLDEIGEMPLQVQSKLLRVLENGHIQPVGSETSKQVDVRIIAATNIPLEQAVHQGQFRADLYHRLAVLRIHLPPLRQRSEDIALLADHFLQQFNRRYHKQIQRFTPEAMNILEAYLWPGNVRELRNLIERLVIENQTPAISARALGEWVRERQSFGSGAAEFAPEMEAPLLALSQPPANGDYIDIKTLPKDNNSCPSRASLQQAFVRSNGNIAAAARLLGMHRATFYRHLHRLGLSREELEKQHHGS